MFGCLLQDQTRPDQISGPCSHEHRPISSFFMNPGRSDTETSLLCLRGLHTTNHHFGVCAADSCVSVRRTVDCSPGEGRAALMCWSSAVVIIISFNAVKWLFKNSLIKHFTSCSLLEETWSVWRDTHTHTHKQSNTRL